ncbi:serine/threonine-protein phosphatase [Nocardioides sp. zg-1308]|uniref:PP2C family protein-serine/threonine phosphatase n=1 Tax=Nocardioides renjunii TaxID=3095075 RepID=A0ABU5KEU1_9ACTN|nr:MULTISPECIES: PP2C family protein-serine/threonine phosphatase [unclassified Nocardioides]MDZ5663493.1 PP2C family protein-serine/threonine phosphatase [Nocardioides sp. S-58]NPD07077.1 serine/threonine-protein phosphatase [Nocardioides sp. zg-1308]WQQ20581.1 PP2C family protein-serine/threonine phosphatase [Nocardioides sp. S-34]
MSNAWGTVVRGTSTYVRQRVEGWRTGSRGSQAFLLTLLVALVVASVGVGAVAEVVVPVSLWFLFLMVGTMLLRFVPLLLLVAVLSAAAGYTSVESDFATASRTSALLIFALAVIVAIHQSSRQRSGLPMALSEAVLTQLRDRLQRQGVVPSLPNGWRSESATITANGPSYAGDFLVADLREGRWLEMALVDVCGKGTSVGPQALQFAGALGGLIGALPPAELMAAANHFLLRQESDESLATAVHIKIDLVTGDYTITSAGHPPALHWHLGQRGWAVDNARGMALGVIDEAEFTPSRGRLRPGEALMFYTDGVIERTDRDLDDGIDWLRQVALQAVDARGFTGMPQRVLKQVPRGDDDRAMLVLERQPLTSPERDSERLRSLGG